MAKQEPLKVTGIVTLALRNARFKVQLPNGMEIICHISGKIRKYYIKILPGDTVDVEMTPYDLTQGRITFRHKK